MSPLGNPIWCSLECILISNEVRPLLSRIVSYFKTLKSTAIDYLSVGNKTSLDKLI